MDKQKNQPSYGSCYGRFSRKFRHVTATKRTKGRKVTVVTLRGGTEDATTATGRKIDATATDFRTDMIMTMRIDLEDTFGQRVVL